MPAARVPRDLRRLIRALQSRAERDRRGLVFVETVACFLHAYATDADFEAVVVDRVLLRNARAQKFVRRLKARGVRVESVRPEAFREVSQSARASGIGAVIRPRWTPLERAVTRPGVGWVVVERIRSAGNLGTILRTAEATGASGLICLGDAVDPWDPAVIRASMGTIFLQQLVRTTRAEAFAWCRSQGLPTVATTPSGERVAHEAPLQGPAALLVGEERDGLSPEALGQADWRVRLPIVGRGDSLNVAVATGILLYEVLRRTEPSAG